MGGQRDTDWFELTTTTARRIIWKVKAEFPFEMALIRLNPDCSNQVILNYTTGQPCQTRGINVPCLAAGTYYFYIAPTVFNGVPCSEYISRLKCGKCIIHGLVINQIAANIHLNWEADESEPVYVIHRGSEPDFEPSAATEIGRSMEPLFTDTNVLQSGAEKYFYVVVMEEPEEILP